MNPRKYIGRTVTIIYQSASGSLSQRRVRIIAVTDQYVRAYCYTRREPRSFAVERILAMELVSSAV